MEDDSKSVERRNAPSGLEESSEIGGSERGGEGVEEVEKGIQRRRVGESSVRGQSEVGGKVKEGRSGSSKSIEEGGRGSRRRRRRGGSSGGGGGVGRGKFLEKLVVEFLGSESGIREDRRSGAGHAGSLSMVVVEG